MLIFENILSYLQYKYYNLVFWFMGTYVYLRKFMALPFLPEQEIPPMFEQLRQQATTAPLQQFVAYVSDT